VLAALTYTSNHFHGGPSALGHLWSLSVEEQFYMLWPALMVLFYRRRLWLASGLLLLAPPLRVLFWTLWGHRGLEHPFPVVMDALARRVGAGNDRTTPAPARGLAARRMRASPCPLRTPCAGNIAHSTGDRSCGWVR
jgi:peptidoglycan/LPS O-acetylase OafA/YrhL